MVDGQLSAVCKIEESVRRNSTLVHVYDVIDSLSDGMDTPFGMGAGSSFYQEGGKRFYAGFSSSLHTCFFLFRFLPEAEHLLPPLIF